MGKFAVKIIGPGMIGTDKRAGAAAAAGNRHPAMAAGVSKDSRLAIAATNSQERCSGGTAGQKIPCIEQRT